MSFLHIILVGTVHAQRVFQDFQESVMATKREDIMKPLTCEETRLMALSVHVVRSIAEKHGGSLAKIKGKKKIQIYVPPDKREACAEQIAQQLGYIRKHVLYPFVALSCGKIIVPLNSN